MLDDRSYGSSPGGDSYPAPYAYLSAHDHDGSRFWNLPFGALRDAAEFFRVMIWWLSGARVEHCCAGLSQGIRPDPRGYSEKAERIHGDH